jgi:hypothetical protein
MVIINFKRLVSEPAEQLARNRIARRTVEPDVVTMADSDDELSGSEAADQIAARIRQAAGRKLN